MKSSTTAIVSACLLAATGAFSLAVAGGGVHSMPTNGTRTHQTPTTTTSSTVREPAMTGQPTQSCGSATPTNTPGNAASAPGSAFNPNGNAGTHYAGQQAQNSGNTASVSQYDAACSHQP